jgi:hypothetical protein
MAGQWDGCRCDSEAPPEKDSGGGTDTTCSPTIHCSNGDAYEICTTTVGTQCIDITYAFTKGESHACASCADCSAAASTAAAQCGAGPIKPSLSPDGGAGPGKDSGGPSVDSGHPDMEAGLDAAEGEDAAGDMVCGEQADQSDCASCCNTDHAAGNAYLWDALVSCACSSGGPCVANCASEACAGADVTEGDACDTCLNDSLSSSGACEGPVLASCDADADCLADVVCQDNECADLPSP